MNIKTADVIRMDWGKFLEITNGNLMMIFLTKIPQNFLPYPKEKIKEALDVISEHFASMGKHKTVKMIESTLPILDLYVDDKEAIKAAAKNFSDKKYLEAIIPRLGQRQKKLLADLMERDR